MKRALLWLPLLLFAGLFALVGFGLLKPANRTVRSALTDKPLPDFTLPALLPGKPGVAKNGYGGGQPRLLNVFASWCLPCKAEAPQLMRLKALGVPIDAVATNDTADGMRDFLATYGDPYQRIGDDKASKVQIALGSSGVPETFLIDGRGRIVMQHVGDIRADEVDGIVAAWRAAK
ncbi:redoxin domain-containing protein [Sphingomonas panacisoli]|uniref:Redoxin domain-containing protein n=1 Tax=Sphingomonas panacisoli TaxID=1813879 RepID=A0A5B8LJH7_9SPHN|nr:redoxin family protein [Sphingomonas panacisoli]QDZ07734.1 redoxin domain-containing protein [Sphingomonas panacisoli]